MVLRWFQESVTGIGGVERPPALWGVVGAIDPPSVSALS
jgi:hypothetical protein